MIHYSPYSGKRKGEHYVKLAKVEADSLERVQNISEDIAGSRHVCESIQRACEELSVLTLYLLEKINKAKEISLLSKADDEQVAKSRAVNKAFSKAGKENKPK